MTAQPGTRDERQVVPRWRAFAHTVSTGELNALEQNLPVHDKREIRGVERRADREGTLYARAELLSALLAQGDRIGARALAQSSGSVFGTPPLLSNLISRLANDDIDVDDTDLTDHTAGFKPSAFARLLGMRASARIGERPTNPIAWVDLALAHTIQARLDLAERELRVALQLAPDSRFVLRSAARFYVHIDEPDQANYLIRASARLEHDPWLMAAELSTAQLAFGRSKRTNTGREMATSARFSPFATSELVSELATAELQAGRDRKARDLFKQSFVDPTENAVAQAVSWSHRSNLELEPQLFNMKGVFEARALDHGRTGAWKEATAEAVCWHQDQPFSLEPFRFASYSASFGSGDYSQAAEIALAGLTLQPTDPMLRNNAAYAMANLDRAEEAEALIRPSEHPVTVDDFTELATLGLIRFRKLDPEAGALLYQRAVVGLERHGRKDLAAMATINWALEEQRLHLPGAERLVKRADKLLYDLQPAERTTLAARIAQNR